tara:strand:- start:178777 stop:179232 length:456 start_codon:yes stop_codon:yes gene_type:complete
MTRLLLYITTVIAAFLISFSGQAQEVQFGRECFGGTTICIQESSGDKSSSLGDLTKSSSKTSFQKLNDNTIRLTVQKNKLSNEEKTAITGESFDTPDTTAVFKQELDYILEKELIMYLGLSPNMSLLKAGTYPLEFTDQAIVITLTLTQLN